MSSTSTAFRDFLTSARWYQLLVIVGALLLACTGIARLIQDDQPLIFLTLILGILAFPATITNPRWGLIIFLWVAHTIDGVKRLIYAFTNFALPDVAKILIVPVLIAAALYIRVFFLSWFGSGIVERIVLKRCWPLILATLGALAFTLRGGLSFESMIANYTLICYIPAGIVVPYIICNTERRLEYVKTLMIIAGVLGIYGLIQSLHGPFDYEVQYMLSGLTVTISAIEGSYFRAFSLMNNGPTFCGTMVMITLLSYFYFCKDAGRFQLNKGVVCMTLFTLFVCFAATQRGALVSFILTLCLVPLCTRPKLFFAATSIGLAVFAALITFADEALESLRVANDVLVGSVDNAFLQQNASILTYAQRLNGFSDLSNPDLWTPFGVTTKMGQVNIMANDISYGHDLISNFLEWFGYIGTGLFLIFCGIFVYIVIMRVRDMQQSPQRSLWAQCNLAVFLFMMIWQLFTGPALMVCPLQFYFWVSIGNVLYLLTEPVTLPETPTSEVLTGLWRPSPLTRQPTFRPMTSSNK